MLCNITKSGCHSFPETELKFIVFIATMQLSEVEVILEDSGAGGIITSSRLFPQIPRSLSSTLSTLGLVLVPMTVKGNRRWVMIVPREFDAFIEGDPHVARYVPE